jgi:hypothetical protein
VPESSLKTFLGIVISQEVDSRTCGPQTEESLRIRAPAGGSHVKRISPRATCWKVMENVD